MKLFEIDIKNKDKILKYSIIIFLLILIFGTKGSLVLGIIPLSYLIYRKKDISIVEILNIFEQGIFYKFFISLIYEYGNMRNESIRLLLLLSIANLFLNFKKINFKLEKISLILGMWFIIGLFWNYFSPGNIESLKIFYKENIYLLIPLSLNILFIKNEILLSMGKRIFPLAIFGLFFKVINTIKVNEIKGNLISILSLVIPYTFFSIFLEKNKYLKFINLIAFITGTWIVLKSGARGALGGIVIGIIIGIILSRGWKGIIISGTLLFVVLIGLKGFPEIESRFLKINDFSTRSRYYLVDAGIYTFKNNIIFGSGRGNTQKYFIEYSNIDFNPEKHLKNDNEIKIVKEVYLKTFPDTHNIFIDFLAEYGLLGVFIAFFIGIVIPFNMCKEYFITKNNEILQILVSLISFFASGMSWSLWTRHDEGIPYFVILLWFFYISQYQNRKY